MKKLIGLFFILQITSFLYSQSLSDEIYNTINDIKTNNTQLLSTIDELMTINEFQDKDIIALKSEKKELEQTTDVLIHNIETMSTKIVNLEVKIQQKNKILTTLIIIFLVMIIAKIVVIILKYKLHITLPYIINCII